MITTTIFAFTVLLILALIGIWQTGRKDPVAVAVGLDKTANRWMLFAIAILSALALVWLVLVHIILNQIGVKL